MNRRGLLVCGVASSALALTRRAAAAESGAAADWTARSTAPGVVQSIRYPSAANVTRYTHPDSMASHVVFDPSDGIIGDGCLKINVLAADGANSGNWRAPLNAAWTADGLGFASAPFYIQYRVKLGPKRLTRSNNGGGFKICNIAGYLPTRPSSSQSHTGHEIVVGNVYWRGSLSAYREHPVSGAESFEIQKDGEIYLQPAVDNGAHVRGSSARYCLYGTGGAASSGCWFYHEQEWFTLYYAIKIVDYGGRGTGNAIDIYTARQGESTYTHLYNNRDFVIGRDPDYPNGVNGIWFLPYDTARTSATYDTWHKYDQLIVSTQPIACPQV